MNSIENGMVIGASQAYEASLYSTAEAEQRLMQISLDACEVGNPEVRMLQAPRCGPVYAKDLVTMNMDEGAVFRLICAAAKSQDTIVRLQAQALIATAANDFAHGWAE